MQAPTSLTPDGQSKSEDFNTLCVVQGQKLQGPQWLSIELVFGEKIAKPQGFPRVLPNWWVMQTKSFSSSPAMLPFAPPDVDVANSIFLEFSSHYRTLEQSLQRARLIQATQRRSQDPLMIYKDIQREKAEPVQTIVAKHAIDIHTVVETSDNTTTITLAKLLPAGVHSFPVQGVQNNFQQIDQTSFSIPAEVATQLEGSVQIILTNGSSA